MRKIIVLTVSLLLTGCLGGDYQPPIIAPVLTGTYSKTLDRPFDHVWAALIDYASTAFFVIDNVEKDSGLLTLSFGAADTKKYIDCGWMDVKTLTGSFNGPYAEYAEIYVSGSLSGKMNILVKPIDDEKTFIRISARYIFQAGTYQTGINTWAFDTGSYQTIRVTNATAGAGNMRTCKPTHFAERTILDALN